MTDRVGQQLGNYRLLRLLGHGGFAEVYLGEHIYLKSNAALKILHAVLKEEERAAFLKEAQTLVRLVHPHIVRVLDFAVEADTPFLVMEYAPRGTLRQRHPTGSRLSLDDSIPYVRQMASALDYAHEQRLIHRDVKPENMLIGSHDDILLSDFGLALLAPHTHPYSTHEVAQQVAGTSLYLAPEQLQGRPHPASDQYALGVVVYEWLCGAPPFRGTPLEIATQHLTMPPPSLRERVPGLAPAVEEIILRALAKEPEQRFASVEEFARALEQAHQQAERRAAADPVARELSSPADHEPQPTVSARKPAPIWKVPTILTPLLGREQEVAAIAEFLKQPDIRLVTVLGTGGIGKTRLALQIASEMRDYFPDGVCFVALAPVSDPALVLPGIADTLEIREVGEQPLFEQVKVALRDKYMLLILDNFEQIVAAASQVEELLMACPHLKLVVTSRIVLHVQGEQEFPASPLALPNLKQLPDLETLSRYGAIALFVQRARAVLPSFQLTPANAHIIAEICIRLDGLPLAIELAAARIKLLPPQALLARLSQRLTLLTSTARTLPERQQTLRNALKWSYDLLDPEEQRLFRRLSVFVGGWTLEAMEAVCADVVPGKDTLFLLDGVASLLDKSLLLQVEQEGEELNLIMLETIREYGLECLQESGELAETQQAHALYFLAWVEQAEPHLKGKEQRAWLKRLEQEQENLRAALQWLMEQQETELALRFCGALWRFWLIRGYWSEGRRWLEAALALPQTDKPTAARAKALSGAGRFAIRLGYAAVGRSLLEEGVALYRKLGDKQGLAESLIMWEANSRNAPLSVRSRLEESVALAREVGDKWTLANSLQDLGWFILGHDGPDEARPLLEKSAAIFRELGDTHSLISVLTALVRAAAEQENLTQAETLAQECLVLARELGNKPDIVEALYYIAQIKCFQDDIEQSIIYCQDCLVLARELGDKHNIARALGTLGDNFLSQGDLIQAETVIEETLVLDREMDNRHNVAASLVSLGRIKRLQGNFANAATLEIEGLSLAREVGHKSMKGVILIELAHIAVGGERFERATLLFGAAEPLNPYVEMGPHERADYEHAVEYVRMQLGEEVFQGVWDKGKAMTLEQVIAMLDKDITTETIAPEPPAKDVKPPAKSAYPDELTAREVEVLRLIAQGWSDSQIAEHLIISPRTVNAHLTSIYRKIQVSSRSAATRYAIDHHLV